ncbi:MAG: protein translocase subunit SecD [Actinobacteria bacterium]|nr:protein translocase subunit SecD [Actinomycetota bacterium]
MKATRYKLYLALAFVVGLGSLAAVFATGIHPRLGLDLEGGTGVILTAQGPARPDVLERTVDIIRRRIDALGVAEPEVSQQGDRNILVQLPGVENDERAREVIGSTAQLTFRQVEETIPPGAKKQPPVTKETGSEANDIEVVYPSSQAGEQGTLYRLKPAVLTGDIVDRAEAVPPDAQNPTWSVSIEMNDEGRRIWGEFTSKLACLRDKGETVKAQVAIVLDGAVESAAGMQTPGEAGTSGVVCGQGIDQGNTSITLGGQAEARDLALVLKTGALPITLVESEVQKVSPTLGRDSLDAGVTAGLLGLGLVVVYMLVYYRSLGVVVIGGLAIFTAIIYSVMSLLGAAAGLSLSLAGVAGIIVSVGVTADSYIVAFERLKDEVHSGRSMRAAVDRGMVRAFRTILVADFVTGAAAVILFFLAVGPVRGFALTLGLATLADVLVAYFYTRSAVGLLAQSKRLAGSRWFGMRQALGLGA